MSEAADIHQQALAYVKSHKKEIVEKFANLVDFPPAEVPQSYFMAGSPGAGKTEFSKGFCALLREEYPEYRIVRLDTDEMRDVLPGYTGKNSSDVQEAAVLAVNKVFDATLDRCQNVFLDGTFARYDVGRLNVARSLKKNRRVGIFYIYQDPLVAWDFTKKREALEGRFVPKSVFIKAFFESKTNVMKIKEEFGSDVQVNLVMMQPDNHIEQYYVNVDSIDSYVNLGYTPTTLEDILHD